MLTWLIDYVKLQFGEVLLPVDLMRIGLGILMQIYKRLMISVHSILLSMDVRLLVYTGLINS